MRATVSLHSMVLSALGCLLLSSPSRAGADASPEPLRWNDVPLGAVTSAPIARVVPITIRAGEAVEGWTLAAIDTEPKAAVAVVRVTSPGSCFTTEAAVDPTRDQDARNADPWSSELVDDLIPKSPFPVLVHAERLVPRGDGMMLETRDAWVDPKTRGARLVAVATLPLRVMGDLPGARVFIGREESRAHVIVLSTATGVAPNAQVMGTDSKGTTLGSICPFARAALNGETGDAESATFFVDATLAPPVPNSKVDPTVRKRRFRVHASIAHLTRDPDPVVAWSFGWAGLARDEGPTREEMRMPRPKIREAE